ncbi:MAG: hypothetical protein CML60_09425 [Rhodobacteraceae bacterium]|nr:hypothetical protein [Paracoccaceae bacterium]MBT26600.1 hypothetical protein [Paracoccaceae bacterium]
MRKRLAVALAALTGLIVLFTPPWAKGPAVFMGTLDLPSNGTKLGGFSAIELSPDGVDFHLITDRGHLLRGRIERTAGNLIGLRHGPVRPLRARNGQVLRKTGNDAEGAAIAPDGTLFISLEGKHRILSFPNGAEQASDRLDAAEFSRLPKNGGLESLAIARDGTLYALPERTWTRRQNTPVFRHGPDGWSALPGYTRTQGFLPVGADFGPNARLYILERHFKGLGFASRVRSFRVTPAGLSDPQLILQTPQRRHGNLEGLSVWRDTQGKIRLTMVSDDNFLSLFRSQIVEYALPKPLAKQGNQD